MLKLDSRRLRQALWLGWAAATGLAQAADVALNLTQPDRYAMRRVDVQRVDGSPLAGVRHIAGFDAVSRNFTLEVPGKGMVPLAAHDLKALVFEQIPARGSPMVQACVATVLAKKGATKQLTLRANAMRIEEENLVVDNSALPPLPTANDRAEVLLITYDPAVASFSVTVQVVNYEVQSGNCGTNGAPSGKALP